MTNMNFTTIARQYNSTIEEYCNSLKLIRPFEDFNLLDKYSKLVGVLRDKKKYDFNKNGIVDFIELALEWEISHTRLIIGEVHFWADQGITPIVERSTKFEPFYFFKNRFTSVDTRFFTSIDIAFSRLYNCWQRIGNFLNIFFLAVEDPARINFYNVINTIPNKFPDVLKDDDFLWLQDFLKNRYSTTVNFKRQDLIHVECSSSAYFVNCLRNMLSKAETERLKNEIDSLPAKLISYYNEIFSGVEHTLLFISRQSGSFPTADPNNP